MYDLHRMIQLIYACKLTEGVTTQEHMEIIHAYSVEGITHETSKKKKKKNSLNWFHSLNAAMNF